MRWTVLALFAFLALCFAPSIRAAALDGSGMIDASALVADAGPTATAAPTSASYSPTAPTSAGPKAPAPNPSTVPAGIDQATKVALFGLLGMVLAFLGMLFRLLTSPTATKLGRFAHSPAGVVVSALVNSILGALVPIVSTGNPTVPALVGGLTAGVGTALGMVNPTMAAQAAKTAAALLLVGGLGLVIPACGASQNPSVDCSLSANATNPKCQLQSATIDCAKTAGTDVASANNLLDVWKAIVGNGSNYLADLLVVAGKVGEGGVEFVSCEIAAIKSYFQALEAGGPPPPVAPAGMKAIAKLDKAAIHGVIARCDAALAQLAAHRTLIHVDKMVVVVH